VKVAPQGKRAVVRETGGGLLPGYGHDDRSRHDHYETTTATQRARAHRALAFERATTVTQSAPPRLAGLEGVRSPETCSDLRVVGLSLP
jgi:hypothetical protein